MASVIERLCCLAGALALTTAACGTQGHGTREPAAVQPPASPSASLVPPSAHSTTARASAATQPVITRSAFGMHFLGYGTRPYPALGFGSVRVWDMGVRWADLQPNSPAWDSAVLARLDSIVGGFTGRQVSPILVFGMTPAWAARPCPHGIFPATTCGPRSTGSTSPWAAYVRFLVTRYDGRHGHPKVTYFETWNEPNLRNGWNDTITEMAALQQTAYGIVHGHGAGQQLLSASWATSYGSGPTSLGWLDTFLAAPGGRAFDITDLHAYPTVPPSKANFGPEWATNRLAAVRAVLANRGVGGRAIWNTEMNIGATYTGSAAAGQVARAYLLGTQSGVTRTFWYAADNRSWGGVFLENPGFASLTPAGVAYRWLADELTGSRPEGCSIKTLGANQWNYTCKYHLGNGRNMLALWTTGAAYTYHVPPGTTRWYTVTGASHAASRATRLVVSHVPMYLVGTP